MQETITVTLPDDVRRALDAFVREEGIPAADVVGQAVKEHLFLQRFRSLRERMAARARNQGVVTDQEVFDRVS